MLFTQKNL
ncbi:hypothetical protein VTH06DRAFT_4763 [Thermothelomyces fergusii]